MSLLSPSSQLQKDIKITEKSNMLPYIYTKSKFVNEEETIKEKSVKLKIGEKYQYKKKVTMSLLK